uniref:Uncharacterized protein n=1 Tax=Helianthus annuus TaxID=4232 RepID=A0A251TCX4_HELAN
MGDQQEWPHDRLIHGPKNITFLNHLDASQDNYTIKVRITNKNNAVYKEIFSNL